MKLDPQSALKNYQELLKKVDETFAGIQARHSSDFHCGLGCHSCCKPALTVNEVEAASIRAHITAEEGLAEKLVALEKANPFKGKRCSLLSAEGGCSIYAARPIVCRSHGAPLQYDPHEKQKDKTEERRMRDVCPLNFTKGNLLQLPLSDVMNLDTINTILELLNRSFASPKRITLTASALTESLDPKP